MWRWVFLSATLVYTTDAQFLLSSGNQFTDNKYMDLYKYAVEDHFPDKAINMDKLIREFTNICPYLSDCDKVHVADPAPVAYQRSQISISACMYCSCGPLCITSGNCCPGSPYQYFRYQPTNVIVNNQIPRTPRFMNLISHCPAWYRGDKFVTSRCVGSHSVLYPVSSLITYLSYKNKYCAACHNETEFYRWPLDTLCINEANVTWESNLQDVLQDEWCWQEFWGRPKLTSVTFVMATDTKRAISTCNATGLWPEFDEDINWACEHMAYHYKGFRNVFCYICNPGLSSKQTKALIDSCNVTGDWTTHIPEVEQGCLSQPQTNRLFPFKNIHCLLCNGVDKFMHGDYFSSSISENVFTSNLNISLTFQRKHAKKFHHNIMEVFKESGVRAAASIKTEVKEKFDDLPDIMDNYAAICGGERKLNTTKITRLYDNCQCRSKFCSKSTNCVERSGGCCPAILLKYRPINCVNSLSVPTWKTNGRDMASAGTFNRNISIIDECLTDNNVSEHFNIFQPDISQEHWANLPLRTGSGYIYKNLSYWLCNTNLLYTYAHIDLEFHCSRYIDHSLFMDIGDFLYMVKDYCDIYFITSNAKSCNQVTFSNKPTFSAQDNFTLPKIFQQR